MKNRSGLRSVWRVCVCWLLWGVSVSVAQGQNVRAWGSNLYGELGNGTTINSAVPIPVGSLGDIVAISGGYHYTLALKQDGTVWTWGSGSLTPLQVSSLSGVKAIAGGSYHSLALKQDGTVWAWGRNDYDQLGYSTPGDFSDNPAQVSGLRGVVAISAGGYHSLALKQDGTVWAWGWNNDGELGNGTYTGSTVPVQVSSLSGVKAIAAGWFHSLALKQDGTVWTWGSNVYGTLGNGTYTHSTVPVQVNNLNEVKAIAAGGGHNLALKQGGTVWAWGRNYEGALGIGTFTGSNIPVQVSKLSGVEAIGGGDVHSLAALTKARLTGLTLNSATITGGLPTPLTLTLDTPAPPGGATLFLTTDQPRRLALPQTVTVPEGATSASFSFDTSPVLSDTPIAILASYGSTVQGATFTLKRNTVQSLQVTPRTLTSHATTTGTVTLKAPAVTSDGIGIGIVSSDPVVSVPSTLVIPMGQTSGSFPITVGTVTQSKTVYLKVWVRGTAAFQIVALTLNP